MTVTSDISATRQRVWELRPTAKARIRIRLEDIPGGGCRVEMSELVISLPLRWVPDTIHVLGVAPGNRECLWRLARIAERNDQDAIE